MLFVRSSCLPSVRQCHKLIKMLCAGVSSLTSPSVLCVHVQVFGSHT